MRSTTVFELVPSDHFSCDPFEEYKSIYQYTQNTFPPDIQREINRLLYGSTGKIAKNVILQKLEILFGLDFSEESLIFPPMSLIRQRLDDELYGMKREKERLLSNLAMAKRSGGKYSKEIHLCGNPGTGKTALGRAFYNAAEIRYTTVPMDSAKDGNELFGCGDFYQDGNIGNIMKAYSQVYGSGGILFNEIDKAMDLRQGDAIFMPFLTMFEQDVVSRTLFDAYVGIPLPFNKIIPICTSNDSSGLPDSLMNRMDTICLPDYTTEERKWILSEYQIPKFMAALNTENIVITEEMIEKIVLCTPSVREQFLFFGNGYCKYFV